MRALAQFMLLTPPAVAAGVWVAVEVVRDFEINGQVHEKLLAILLVTAVIVAIFGGVSKPVYSKAERATLRAFQDAAQEPLSDPFQMSDREFFAPIFRLWRVFALRAAVFIVDVTVLAPAALWLGAQLSSAVGLPVTLSGFWPVVVAGLVVYAIRSLVSLLINLVTWRLRGWWAVRALFLTLIPVAGVGLAVALLGGLHLQPATPGQQAMALIVLAALFSKVSLEFGAPFITTIARVAGNALKLWLVAWLSGWMEIALEISSFWTLILAALIITAVNWFKRLADAPIRPPSDPIMSDYPDFHDVTRFY